MGASASQCCAACTDRSAQELIESSPAFDLLRWPKSEPAVGRASQVVSPAEDGSNEVLVGAFTKTSVAAASTGLPEPTTVKAGPAAAAAFGTVTSLGDARVPALAITTASTHATEGSLDTGAALTTTRSSGSSAASDVTLTPRLGPGPRGAPTVQPTAAAVGPEQTDDLTEATLPPKEETLELSAAGAAAIAAPAAGAPPPTAAPLPEGGEELEGDAEAPSPKPVEAAAEEESFTNATQAEATLAAKDHAFPPTATITDPLQEAIEDGSCKLQTDFGSPRKEPIREATTPPTAVPGSPGEPEPEAWADFLERASARLREAGIAEEAGTLFEVFLSTDDLGLTYASFARLHALAMERVGDADVAAAQPPWAGPTEAPGRSWRFPYQAIQRLLGSHWKAQKLWRLIGERAGRPEYAEAPCSKGRLAGKRCLVVGAGPCGLRAAIELRLLGAQVTVVEQRVRFTRINQLHIWSWCGEDLKGLGARIIEPPPKDFGSNPDLLVIAINDLQKLLLKVALLYGADVRLGLSYAGLRHEGGTWTANLSVASAGAGVEGRAGEPPTPATPWMSLATPGGMPPSPFLPGPLTGLAAVLGSGGFASTVGEEVGMRMVETESLRRESAIGLICNVARTNGKAEADLRSYSMARQFYTAMFKRAAEETGADLENIVYVKAPTAHYFVMTPTPKSLIASGVVIDENKKPMLVRENVSQEKLDELVRRVLSFRFKQGEPTVMEAVSKDLGGSSHFPGYADSGPRLFDFSKMRRSSEGITFLPPMDRPVGMGEDANLLVALAGDALIEPFWPEGLGIVRGFFSVLDSCYAIQQWSNGASCAATQEVSSAAFQQLKTLSAATRARVLREDEKKFGLAPKTRYR